MMSRNSRYTILVHGGTVSGPEAVTEDRLHFIKYVVETGRQRLAAGAAALDAVVEAIVSMEDSGLFDAGKGSYFNRDGFVENDAALADGHTGRAGAAALLRRLKNPIRAARLVMERTDHVMLAGATGEQVLIDLGAELITNPSAYFTPTTTASVMPDLSGTVGAVALDTDGRLAAATSTGGTRHKLPGRVSDSAIIGAGTFANRSCAVSATGKGEYFIRRSAAADIALRAAYAGMSLQQSADYVVRELIGRQDSAMGAVIALGLDGKPVISANGYGVLHGHAADTAGVCTGARIAT
jgi:isoaspartyl peptidase/L-asparaginase-like protein (Ntn-hydrolase superfamily)